MADPKVCIGFNWQRHPGGRPTAGLRRLAIRALEATGAAPAEIGVLVCDDATIRSLNRRYRARDAATDVLAFPSRTAQPEGPPYLGDVAISLETAARQARTAGVTLARELQQLLLHGVLHLCGYDHETDAGEMRALEARLRRQLVR